MKKLTLTLTLVVAACAAFAAPEKFLSWNLNDVATIKAQLAKPDTVVPAYRKVWYAYLLAKLEAPDSIDTLAKCEQVIAAATKQYGSTVDTAATLLTVLRNTKDGRFLDEISKSAKYTGTDYYRQYYVLPGLVPASTSERRDIAFEFAEKYIKRGKAAEVGSVIDKYVEFSLDDDDAAVVKGLQRLNRLVLPKLTGVANDPWLPVSAKLALALKSRGVSAK